MAGDTWKSKATAVFVVVVIATLVLLFGIGRLLKGQPDKFIDPGIVRNFNKRISSWLGDDDDPRRLTAARQNSNCDRVFAFVVLGVPRIFDNDPDPIVRPPLSFLGVAVFYAAAIPAWLD